MAWSAIARLSAQVFTWIVTILVTRLLSPQDVGVVASAAVFIGLMRAVTEFGLGSAIVAQRSLTERQIAQLGGMALLLGLFAAILTTTFASPLSAWMHVPQLRAVLPVLGISAALTTLNALPTALLQRRLDFKTLSTLDVLRALTGSVALLLFAAAGFGYWSLVLNELVACIVFAVVMYWKTRYTLAFPRFSEIRSSLRLSSEVMASRIAFYVYSNADLGIVSAKLGTMSAGLYSMAWTLTTLPSEKINTVIMAVTPGIFAQAQHSDEELGRYFLLLVEGLTILLYPATVGLALVAPELVPVVLGDKWRATVPVIQVLAVFLTVRSIAPICTQVLVARMRGTIVLRYALLMTAVLPLGFLIGSRWGVVGVASAWAILFPPIALSMFITTCREIDISIFTLARVVVRPAAAVVLMSVAVLATRALLIEQGAGEGLRLPLLVAVGALTYGAVALLFMRERARTVLALIRSRK